MSFNRRRWTITCQSNNTDYFKDLIFIGSLWCDVDWKKHIFCSNESDWFGHYWTIFVSTLWELDWISRFRDTNNTSVTMKRLMQSILRGRPGFCVNSCNHCRKKYFVIWNQNKQKCDCIWLCEINLLLVLVSFLEVRIYELRNYTFIS